MNLGRGKPNRGDGVSRPSDPADHDSIAQPDHDSTAQLYRRWQTWRLAAENAKRAWHDFLAADRHARAAFYDRYVSALAREQRAAARLEAAVALGATVDTVVEGTNSCRNQRRGRG